MIAFSELFQIAQIHWEIISLFFVIAVLYSSVGFGGGSSYLAVLALTGLAFTEIRSTALLCNIVVVSGNTFLYVKNHIFDWKKIFPLVFLSVPLAFIGGFLKINYVFFFILLGITLIVAAYLMWNTNVITKKASELNLKNSFFKDLINGGFIGFISGMVGIGGGVFLAPLLHLTKWDTPKKIAAASSFFILVNSIAGLGGQFLNPDFGIEPSLTILLLITVFIGGQIGSRFSLKYITPFKLKRATAILIAFVAIRILYKYLF